MNKIPFLLFSGKKSRALSRIFFGVSEKIQFLFPKFEILLQQADINLKKDSFFALVLLNVFIYFLFFGAVFSVISYYLNLENYILLGLLFSTVISSLIFLRIIFGVKLIILKKIKSIESNLIFGLKVFLVEVNSGVSLFNSMILVSLQNLGELSNVFREISKRMSAGEIQEDVLNDVATKNPSDFLKKVLRQMISGLSSGSEINSVVKESLIALKRQQQTDIIQYGSSLKTFTLIFMMLGVIIPTMGLAFLSVVNSLPGINFGGELFFIFLILIMTLQFMLVGLIKSKRPNLMGSF